MYICRYNVYIYMFVCFARVSVRMYICMCVCGTYMYIHTYTYMHIQQTHTHTQTHKRAHTHAHLTLCYRRKPPRIIKLGHGGQHGSCAGRFKLGSVQARIWNSNDVHTCSMCCLHTGEAVLKDEASGWRHSELRSHQQKDVGCGFGACCHVALKTNV